MYHIERKKIKVKAGYNPSFREIYYLIPSVKEKKG